MFYKNGKFNQQEMMRQRFNVADIMEELRGNNVCNLNDVEYIVMETERKRKCYHKTGKVGCYTRTDENKNRPVRMSYIIIDNGTPVYSCMKSLGLNDEWLSNKMKEHGIKNVRICCRYLSFEEKTGNTVVIPMDKK